MENTSEKITITLDGYNIEKCCEALAFHLIQKEPCRKSLYYAKVLGISERTFLRWKSANPHWRQYLNGRAHSPQEMINKLRGLGYEIIKKEEN